MALFLNYHSVKIMNKKPTQLKSLTGNPGKRPLADNEPKPKAIIPKIPKELDKVAVKAWKRLAPTLHKLGLLTEIDGDSFGNLCQIRSRLVKINEELKKKNSLVEIETIEVSKDITIERERISNYVKLEQKYYQLFRLYAADFGLSPRGRTGLVVSGEKEISDFENLLD